MMEEERIQVKFAPTKEELDCLIFVDEYGIDQITEMHLFLLEGIQARLEEENPGMRFPIEGLSPQR